LDELTQDAGSGLQNITTNDLQMPIVRILQSNSPQCKRSEGAYIAGAIEGMLINNVSNELMDGTKGIRVIPAFFEKKYLEWKPNRGGLAGIHDVDTPLKNQVTMMPDKAGKMLPTLANGNNLSEVAQHYVLILKEDGTFEPAVLSMASSQLKTSRIWNSLMKKIVLSDGKGGHFTPASFLMTYKITTIPKTKDNNSWYVFNVESAGPTPTKNLYDAAKVFNQAISAGKVQVKIDEALQADHEAAPMTINATEDDSIPF